jgi:hypothetical protein
VKYEEIQRENISKIRGLILTPASPYCHARELA